MKDLPEAEKCTEPGCHFCRRDAKAAAHDAAVAELAELRAAVRTYLDASRASWTGGPATAAAYEAELRLATLVATSAPPAGSK